MHPPLIFEIQFVFVVIIRTLTDRVIDTIPLDFARAVSVIDRRQISVALFIAGLLVSSLSGFLISEAKANPNAIGTILEL